MGIGCVFMWTEIPDQSQEREQDLHEAFEQFQASKQTEEQEVQTQVAQLHSLLSSQPAYSLCAQTCC